MNRVLALAPLGFLVACGCTRDLRPAEPPPTSVALETPRWTVLPMEAGERPDVLVVDWSAEAPAPRRLAWTAARALVLGGAPREASFRVFRRPHFEWLVPADVAASPQEQAVRFLGGAARDVDLRYGRLRRARAGLAGVPVGDLAHERVPAESGLLTTR